MCVLGVWVCVRVRKYVDRIESNHSYVSLFRCVSPLYVILPIGSMLAAKHKGHTDSIILAEHT